MPNCCEFIGCNIHPTFAKPGETRKRCKKHKQEGDVDLVNKTCEFVGCDIRPNLSLIHISEPTRPY